MRLGHGELIDSMVHDGLWDAYEDYHMGCCGEIVAETYGVTREQQDAFALESHRKAIAAIKAGKFKDEILPVPIPPKKGEPVPFAVDESPREDTSLEALARLKPAFQEGGTVTAGNAPGVNDGAAALVVTSAETAQGAGPHAAGAHRGPGHLRPGAEDGDDDAGAGDPQALGEDGLDAPTDVDLYELNEAFAVQARRRQRASWGSTPPRSTSTAARSRSATPSGPAARAS